MLFTKTIIIKLPTYKTVTISTYIEETKDNFCNYVFYDIL